MAIELPKPIADYFTADRSDAEDVSRCFTEDAVVKDEGQTGSRIYLRYSFQLRGGKIALLETGA